MHQALNECKLVQLGRLYRMSCTRPVGHIQYCSLPVDIDCNHPAGHHIEDIHNCNSGHSDNLTDYTLHRIADTIVPAGNSVQLAEMNLHQDGNCLELCHCPGSFVGSAVTDYRPGPQGHPPKS